MRISQPFSRSRARPCLITKALAGSHVLFLVRLGNAAGLCSHCRSCEFDPSRRVVENTDRNLPVETSVMQTTAESDRSSSEALLGSVGSSMICRNHDVQWSIVTVHVVATGTPTRRPALAETISLVIRCEWIMFAPLSLRTFEEAKSVRFALTTVERLDQTICHLI